MRRFVSFIASAGIAASALLIPPVHATGWWSVTGRNAVTQAVVAGRTATIDLQEIAYRTGSDGETFSKPWLCVGVDDAPTNRYAATCAIADFTIDTTLTAARAVGSLPAEIRRASDGTKLGTTTIRYDIAWVDMGVPLPRATLGAHGCTWGAWAPDALVATLTPTVEDVNFGGSTGHVSADGIGDVAFSDNTLRWDSFIGAGTALGAWDEVATPLPSVAGEQCRDVWIHGGLPPRADIS